MYSFAYKFQVWLQMVHHKVNLAALTNYSVMIFFIRRGDTLFMSGEYKGSDAIILATTAFFAYALGKIQSDVLKLPTVEYNWREKWAKWDSYGADDTAAAGLHLSYVLQMS